MRRTIVVGAAVATIAVAAVLVSRGREPKQSARESDRTGERDASDRRRDDLGAMGPVPSGLQGDAIPSREPAVPDGGTSDRLVVVGRVVDVARHPLVAAEVTLRVPGLPEALGTTDAAGRFRIAANPPLDRGRTRATLRATARDGRGALRTVGVSPSVHPIDAGVLVADATAAMHVRVDRGGGAVAGADVVVFRAEGVDWGDVGAGVSDAAGRATFSGLPPGSYRVTARAAGGGRGHAQGELRAPAREVMVTLPPTRALTVRTVDGETQSPVPGAHVRVYERIPLAGRGTTTEEYRPALTIAPTDDAGRTEIVGLAGADVVYLATECDGWTDAPVFERDRAVTPVAAGVAEVTIHLHRLVRRTWRIVPGEAAPPPHGTVLVVRPRPGAVQVPLPPTATVDGDRIVGDGFGSWLVQAVATAPDGTFTHLFATAREDDGLEAAFQHPRRAVVRVRRADGVALAGRFVLARTEGGRDLCEPVATDADGRAALALGDAGRVNLYVGRDATRFDGRPVGALDLSAGDGALDLVLPLEVELRLSVRIDGTPGLPATYAIDLAGDVDPVAVIAEDAERGVLDLAVPAAALGSTAPPLRMFADGYLPATVTATVTGGLATATAELRRAGRVTARVLMPMAATGVVPKLLWQRRLDPQSPWESLAVAPSTLSPEFDAGDGRNSLVERPSMLESGRYRVVDEVTGAVSTECDVVAGSLEAEILLDLSRAGLVEGTVSAPPDTAFDRARVRVDDPRAGRTRTRSQLARVAADGRFSVAVPGSHPVTLRVEHPLLLAEPASVVVTTPRRDVCLQLVRGAGVRFTPPPPGDGWLGPPPDELRVLLFDAEPAGPPRAEHLAIVGDDGVARVGGMPSGTWTIWIDLGVGVPVVRRRVHVTAGEFDLGSVAAEEGSVLRGRIDTTHGGATPRVSVWVTRDDAPPYARGITTDGESEAVVGGLAAGRYVVRWGIAGSDAPRHQRIVDVDGVSEVAIDLDLR